MELVASIFREWCAYIVSKNNFIKWVSCHMPLAIIMACVYDSK